MRTTGRTSAGSNGEFRIYRLNERATTFQQSGQDITQPARQSFEIRTNVVQALPGGFRARGSRSRLALAREPRLVVRLGFDHHLRAHH